MDGAAGAGCGRARDLLGDYLEDRLPAVERGDVRLHLAACRACRREAAARDPLQILAPLSVDELPERYRDGFWAEIQAKLPAPPGNVIGVASWRAPWTRHPARAALLVGAAAAALVAVLLVPRLLDRRAAEPPATIAQSGAGIPFGQMAMEASRRAPQPVEQVRTPGARPVQVYSMKYYLASAASGGPALPSPPVTELVLIVDEGLDL